MLEVCDDGLAGDALVARNGAEDCVERAKPERVVIRDRDPMMHWLRGLEDDVAAGLMCSLVLPPAA